LLFSCHKISTHWLSTAAISNNSSYVMPHRRQQRHLNHTSYQKFATFPRHLLILVAISTIYSLTMYLRVDTRRGWMLSRMTFSYENVVKSYRPYNV
jgi:hypothetical protein